MTLEFFCVENISSGEFYVGGSYGGNMASYPKLYRRESDAEKVLKTINEDRKRFSFGACHGKVRKNDILKVRKAQVIL